MTFETRHDAGRLGKLTALEDGQPLALASLADLVRYTMGGDSASGLPLTAAAAEVLDKIQSADPLPVIYETQPSCFAKAIPADRVKRPGREATQHHVTFERPRGSHSGGWQVQPNAGSSLRAVVVPKQSARIELRGPAGCLEWLREVWTKNPKGEALLSDPQCARYAMRLDLAQALFDFGPDVKGAPTVAHAVATALPTTAAPHGAALHPLAGLPKHDAKRWGAPHSAEQPPRRLVRLADLARMVCARCGVESPQYCAGQLLEKLEPGSLPNLFGLQPGPLAVQFADDHLWRKSFTSGTEKHTEWLSLLQSGIASVSLRLADGEKAARGLDPNSSAYDLDDAEVRTWPGLSELRGPAGALELMRQQWGQQAQTFDDLDTGPLASVAILEADAVRLAVLLFGPLAAASAASPVGVADRTAGVCLPAAAASQVLHLVPATDKAATDARDATELAELRQRIKDHKPVQKPGARWPDTQAMLRVLLQQYNERMTLPGAFSKAVEENMAALWEMEPTTVHKYLTDARKLVLSIPDALASNTA